MKDKIVDLMQNQFKYGFSQNTPLNFMICLWHVRFNNGYTTISSKTILLWVEYFKSITVIVSN